MNLFRLQLSYLFSRKSPIFLKKALPSFISVEPANFCQLHCPECPVGKMRTKKSDTQFFNDLSFKNLIDELKSTLIHVIFYFQGEPLLNKNLPEMIRYAHDNGIYTSTSTNAQLLHSEMAKSLIESGLDKLIVSIDGTTQETYEKYRRGGSLEKAVEGVKEVMKWKKELKSTTPLLEIQFLVLKTNEHEMAKMEKLAKTLQADKLTFKTAQLYDFENGHELLTSIKKYARYEKRQDGKYHIKGAQPNRCWRLWSGAVVTTNGDVLPCCFDKNSDFSFDNINSASFSACWHGEKATNFRKKFLQNRKQFAICRNCTQ
jgi:radical SAM protein with 4Fe4S-binding SPASM domain